MPASEGADPLSFTALPAQPGCSAGEYCPLLLPLATVWRRATLREMDPWGCSGCAGCLECCYHSILGNRRPAVHPCQLDAAIALCSVAQSFLLQMICSLTIPHSRRLVEHSTCWLQTHRQSTPCTHSPPPAPLLEEQLTGNTFMSLLNARLLVTHQRASARSIPEYIYKSSLLPFFFFFLSP